MKEVFVLYNCDVWHTRSSFRTMGVYDNMGPLVKDLRLHYKISDHQAYLLHTIKQTQTDSDEDPSYEGEFYVETLILNSLYN